MRDPLPEARARAPLNRVLKVIGIGNAYRADDAVGLVVARTLAGDPPAGAEVLEREGEPTSLMDSWEEADTVWVVDAVSSGAPAGTIHRIEATEEPLPVAFARSSTHHFSLPEAVELARAVGRLPRRLVVYGVEGSTFGTGESLSPEVEAAVERVAEAIRDEVDASRTAG